MTIELNVSQNTCLTIKVSQFLGGTLGQHVAVGTNRFQSLSSANENEGNKQRNDYRNKRTMFHNEKISFNWVKY
jgi:hypothetical protein